MRCSHTTFTLSSHFLESFPLYYVIWAVRGDLSVCSVAADRGSARRKRHGQDPAVGRGNVRERQSSAAEPCSQSRAEAHGNAGLRGRRQGSSTVRWVEHSRCPDKEKCVVSDLFFLIDGVFLQVMRLWSGWGKRRSSPRDRYDRQDAFQNAFDVSVKWVHVQGSQFSSVPTLKRFVFQLSPSDQLPEQRDCGPAAEERGAEAQTEEARSGWVQWQRRDWWVRNIRCKIIQIYNGFCLSWFYIIVNWIHLVFWQFIMAINKK